MSPDLVDFPPASAILLVKSGKWGHYHGDNRPIGDAGYFPERGTTVYRTLAIALTSTMLASPAAWAQSAVAVGAARSDSAAISGSRATAVGGGQGLGVGTGGAAQGGSVTINSNVPAQTTATINNTGTSTVRNVPSVFAPGLAAAGLETCLGSVSGGGSFVGTGFSFGSTIPDPGCAARLDARTLWSMGLKKAAIARLCLGSDIQAAMPDVCGTYLPQPGGYVAPVGYYLSEGQSYAGGPIMLVEGKTGRERLCQNYDEPKHRCRVWDGESRVVTHHRAKKPVQVATAPATPPQADPAKIEGK